MRPQIFYIAGVNTHQHFLRDSEIWWIFEIKVIVKITTIFQKYALSRKIRDLRTCTPGARKFLNFLKNLFPGSETLFEVFMAHEGLCDFCKH